MIPVPGCFIRGSSALALIALLGLGCSESGGHPIGPTVSDSSGVQIVMNRSDEPPARWRLADHPKVRIGSVEGDGPDVFGFVGAIQYVEGAVVVGDPMNARVSVFGTDGEFRFAVGGRGQGPGEFMSIDVLEGLNGDTVAIFDRRLQRVSLLSLGTQAIGRTFALNGAAGGDPELVGAISPDHLLFRNDEISPRPGLSRQSALVVRASLSEGTVDTVGVFPGMEMYWVEVDGEREIGAVPFGLTGWLAVGEGVFAYGSGESVLVDVYDPQGRMVRSIRTGWTGPTVDADARSGYVESRLRGNDSPEMRRRVERVLEALSLPRTGPAHSRMLYDSEGNLWVAGTRAGGWVVFGPGGELLAGIDVPDRTFPMQITDEIVWALQIGEMDHTSVVGYQIIRE